MGCHEQLRTKKGYAPCRNRTALYQSAARLSAQPISRNHLAGRVRLPDPKQYLRWSEHGFEGQRFLNGSDLVLEHLTERFIRLVLKEFAVARHHSEQIVKAWNDQDP